MFVRLRSGCSFLVALIGLCDSTWAGAFILLSSHQQPSCLLRYDRKLEVEHLQEEANVSTQYSTAHCQIFAFGLQASGRAAGATSRVYSHEASKSLNKDTFANAPEVDPIVFFLVL
jgi:hypothetical protein